MTPRKRIKGPACPNCGTELRAEFEFCPKCGQENHDMRVPFGQLFMDFLGSLTNFDAKLWCTLKVIVLRPGQLTMDYVSGRRARYVVPGRFYLFISVIFFALLSAFLSSNWTDDDEPLIVIGEGDTAPLKTRRSELRSILGADRTRSLGWADEELDDLDIYLPIDAPHYRGTADHLRPGSMGVLDSLLHGKDTLEGARERLRGSLALLPEADSLDIPFVIMYNGMPASFESRNMETLFRSGRISESVVDSLITASGSEVSWLERRIILAFGRMDLQDPFGRKQVTQAIIGSVPFVMFLLMPFAAVLLFWAFSMKRFYWEHLIFSLHLHSILFLFGGLYLLFALVIDAQPPASANALFLFGCLVYLLIALHRVYGRGWIATVLRAALMAVPYSAVMLLLLSIGIVWGLITL